MQIWAYDSRDLRWKYCCAYFRMYHQKGPLLTAHITSSMTPTKIFINHLREHVFSIFFDQPFIYHASVHLQITYMRHLIVVDFISCEYNYTFHYYYLIDKNNNYSNERRK